MIFNELTAGQEFVVVETTAPSYMLHTPLVKIQSRRMTLGNITVNAAKVPLRGDEYDEVYVNSRYEVEATR